MIQRVIENTGDVQGLVSLLRHRDKPCTVSITQGKPRSTKQNRLQRLWCKEAAEQLGDESAEDKRAYCKLMFGCAILYHEDEDFAQAFDDVIRPLSYENKIKAMRLPLDMPVTRLMKTAQKKQYLDRIWEHFTGQGVRLTDPDTIPEDS